MTKATTDRAFQTALLQWTVWEWTLKACKSILTVTQNKIMNLKMSTIRLLYHQAFIAFIPSHYQKKRKGARFLDFTTIEREIHHRSGRITAFFSRAASINQNAMLNFTACESFFFFFFSPSAGKTSRSAFSRITRITAFFSLPTLKSPQPKNLRGMFMYAVWRLSKSHSGRQLLTKKYK